MTEEQSFVLADPGGSVDAPGAFRLAAGTLRALDRVAEAFRTGDGLGQHEHSSEDLVGCAQYFRPMYVGHLVAHWLPALEGVIAKLECGARVADVGCGSGEATVLMAQAYPQSTFLGSDCDEGSINQARKHAAEIAAAHRLSFVHASALDFPGGSFDLVTTFDCLHHLGNPLGAAMHIRSSLAPDGTWMIVEPRAEDAVEDNLNPVGRVYYSLSAFLCVPNALAQDGGYALGALAGEAVIGRIVADAGFGTFRRVAETPLNIVYEAKP